MTSPRWIRLEAALWQTSALLLVDGDEAVAIDPCVTAEEIAAVAARADAEGARVGTVIATHGDWDHVCGISAFPDAVAAMSPRAAERVRSGTAASELVEEGSPLGISWSGEPRCDRELVPGRACRLGPFEVETMPLNGHTDDGIGLRVRRLGLLAVGDYLSTIEFPFVYHSTAEYRTTLAGLLDLLRHDAPETVVSGHGPPLTAEHARETAEADLDYLRRLRDAVADAHASGASNADAIARGMAVELPRAADYESGELRRNAELQLAEVRADAAV